MKFDLTSSGQKKLIIIGIIVLLVIIGIIVVVVRSRSKYAYPDAADTTQGGGATLVSDIAACTTLYRSALQQGKTDSTPPKAQCIQDAVNRYFTAKCPFVFTPGTAPTTPPAAVTAYNQFMGINLAGSAVGDAASVTGDTTYVNLVSAPTPANGVLADWILKARKADLTGPTRKYISTACNGFYKPADSTVTDPSTSYGAWTKASTAPTSGYGFYPTYVTAPRIYEWALKVATPVTVTTEVAAVAAVASGTAGTKVISITPALTTALATGTKIKLAGLAITQTFTTSAAIGATSLTLNYTGDGVAIPVIPAGTAVCLSTASAVSSVVVSGTTVPLGTAPPTLAVSEMVLTLGAALDSSLVVESSVLLSGSTITGPITIKSINDGSTRQNVTVQWSPAQTVPILPPGLTIESVLDNPIAVPLISSNPGPVYVTVQKAAVASTITGQAYTVNLGTGIPTTTGAIIIPSLFPSTTTFTATATSTSVTLTPNAAVTWPIVPVGTMLFKASDGTPVTVAQAPSLYNKVGTLNGQKMYNWQIAQTVGPGTYWFSGSPATNQIQWGA